MSNKSHWQHASKKQIHDYQTDLDKRLKSFTLPKEIISCKETSTCSHRPDIVLKRESKIKSVKIAESFLKSDSRDFWKECDKLRGRNICPITTVEGFTDSDDIADAFSNHYNELYNSVDYDEDGMNITIK